MTNETTPATWDDIRPLHSALNDHVNVRQRAEMAAGAFLAGYGVKGTRESYALILRRYFQFLYTVEPDIDPMRGVHRGHIDLFLRSLEERGLAPGSLHRYISVVATWYRWLCAEAYCEKDPTKNVKRPTLPRESPRAWLSRIELTDWLAAAEREGGYPYALACLLGINGLRIGEACGADVTDLGKDRYHHTLHIVGKGNQPAVIALPPRVVDAINAAIGDRTEGPLILTIKGTRMQREGAGRIVRRFARQAGIDKHISPHSLRHSAITAYLNATDGDITGARDFARHVNIDTTMIYDRRRKGLDSAGSYIVANLTGGRD